MRDFLLLHIRKYGPISTAEFKSDLRCMARNGAHMGDLDENKVIRTLLELAGEGLIIEKAGGWIAAEVKEPAKPKGLLF